MHDRALRSPVHPEAAPEPERPRAKVRRPPPILQRVSDAGGEDAREPSLSVSMPSDPAEQEAERVADSIVDGERVKVDRAPAKVSVPRAANEDERGGEPGAEPLVRDVLETSGAPLDAASRARLEPSFGQDLSSVRVHTDAPAARSAEAVSAKAYTVGDHIVFGAGQYAPHTDAGTHLLAHEVTHVVQQSQGLSRSPDEEIKVQRDETDNGPGTAGSAAAASAGSPPPAGSAAGSGLIAEDGAGTLDPKQMYKSAFLGALRAAVDQVVDETVTDMVDRIAAGPIVAARFAMYSGKDARSLEQEIKSQAPGAQGAASAAALIPPVAAKVRADIEADKAKESRAKTDNAVSGGQLGNNPLEGVKNLLPGIFFKGREGGPNKASDPSAIQAQLQGGEPIPSKVRSDFESAMGQDFSGVRVHTGANATKLSNDLNARAFTVGHDIAFGAGEYKPGTPVGDALIAHELAHVAQQGGAAAGEVAQKSESAHDGPLEQDADDAAAGAVVSIWGGIKDGALSLARKAGARLKSGLRLQRCDSRPPGTIKDKLAEVNKEPDGKPKDRVNSGVWYAHVYHYYVTAKHPEYKHLWEDGYWTGYTKGNIFSKDGSYLWTLSSSMSASKGLDSWFHGLTIADCGSTLTAVQLSVLRGRVGDEKFDELFGSSSKRPARRAMVIGQAMDPEIFKDLAEEVGEGDLQEGDRVYIAGHPQYSHRHPGGAWQGEHAVFVGKGPSGEPLFSGFGVGAQTEDDMLKGMIKEYNHDKSPADEVAIARAADDLGDEQRAAELKKYYNNPPPPMAEGDVAGLKQVGPFRNPWKGKSYPKAGLQKGATRLSKKGAEKVKDEKK